MEGKPRGSFERWDRAVAAGECIAEQRFGKRRRELEKAERLSDRSENVRDEMAVVQFAKGTRVDDDFAIAPRQRTVGASKQQIARRDGNTFKRGVPAQFRRCAAAPEVETEF